MSSYTLVKQLYILIVLSSLFASTGCSKSDDNVQENEIETLALNGIWITEADGSVMQDPQTSGLVISNGLLISISDGSAIEKQRRKLHYIDPNTGIVLNKLGPMSMSLPVRRSCFAQYLSDEPDFEAIVRDPTDPSVFIIVTEDATRSGALSTNCQAKYSQSGSTAYPTLLVRIKVEGDSVTMTHVRPIKFPVEYGVGDFPNDGIEGMALALDRQLYLGLERDTNGQPRIFSLSLDELFWETSDFAEVSDPQLILPRFSSGSHPINGLDYLPIDGHSGVLVAAARNDEELWLVDLEATLPTQRIKLSFNAATGIDNDLCDAFEVMDNASLEGVAIDGDTLWLVNDPWKKHYLDNVNCETNRSRYEAMAPLLFSVKIDPDWLAPYQPPGQ